MYVCLFFFRFVLVDRQKQEVVTQTAKRVGQEEKWKTQPTNITNQSPLPRKLRQRCRPLPCQGVVQMGWKKKTNKNKETNQSALFSTPYRKKKNQRNPRSADINTSEHIISIHFLSPRPINRFSSVRTRWLVGAGRWGCTCLSFTYIY